MWHLKILFAFDYSFYFSTELLPWCSQHVVEDSSASCSCYSGTLMYVFCIFPSVYLKDADRQLKSQFIPHCCGIAIILSAMFNFFYAGLIPNLFLKRKVFSDFLKRQLLLINWLLLVMACNLFSARMGKNTCVPSGYNSMNGYSNGLNGRKGSIELQRFDG